MGLFHTGLQPSATMISVKSPSRRIAKTHLFLQQEEKSADSSATWLCLVSLHGHSPPKYEQKQYWRIEHAQDTYDRFDFCRCGTELFLCQHGHGRRPDRSFASDRCDFTINENENLKPAVAKMPMRPRCSKHGLDLSFI